MRFCSTYNLLPEENTKKAMIDCLQYLTQISSERILTELIGIITGDNVFEVLNEFKQVLFTIIPDLKGCETNGIDLKLYFNAIKNCTKSFIARFSILLLPCKNNSTNVLNNLKFDGKTKKIILQILSLLECSVDLNKVEIKKIMRILGKNTPDFIECYVASQSILGNNIDKAKLLGIHYDIISNDECYTLSQLKVNGNDLIELGYKGAKIKEILEKVLNLVIEDKLLNDKSVIIEYLKNYG